MIVLPLVLITGVAILAIRSGRDGLVRLAHLHVRHPNLVILAVIAQAANVLTQHHRLGWSLISAGLLAIFFWHNRRAIGMPMIMLGCGLNLSVIVANGGTMPVSPQALAQVHAATVQADTVLPWSKAVVTDDSTARLAWLGDRIVLPGPFTQLAAWSIGDICLLIGVGQLIATTMLGTTRHTRYGEPWNNKHDRHFRRSGSDENGIILP